jgi:hypothetical protein
VCVEACRAHLLGLDAKGLAWATALTMLRLPAGLRESDAFAAVTEVGWLTKLLLITMLRACLSV